MFKSKLKSLLRRVSPDTLHYAQASGIGTTNHGDRARWIEATLQKLPPGLRLLDAGAGEQPYRPFCAHLKYVAQDFAQYDGKGDGSGLQMGRWDQTKLDLVCDITAIPEPAASFDAVLCTEVLEHVTDPIKVLREFSRILRPGGFLILTAPFGSLSHFAPFHYHTGFSRYFYQHHFGVLGFEIQELTCNGNFFEFVAQETRRIPWVAEKYTGARVKLIDRFAIALLLRTLSRLNAADRDSAELACHGIHVVARRRIVDK